MRKEFPPNSKVLFEKANISRQARKDFESVIEIIKSRRKSDSNKYFPYQLPVMIYECFGKEASLANFGIKEWNALTDWMKEAKANNGSVRYSPFSIMRMQGHVKSYVGMFYDFVTNKERPSWMRAVKKVRAVSKRITEDNVLKYPDILGMVKAARNPRDAFFCYGVWESGIRLNEAQSIQLGAITHKQGKAGKYAECKIKLSKTKEGTEHKVIFALAYPYLVEWLRVHPDRNNKDAFMFCTFGRNGTKTHKAGRQLSKPEANILMRNLARRAGVAKPCSPHSLRHSRTTWELQNGFSETEINKLRGYAKGSAMVQQVYGHLSSQDARSKYLQMIGMDEPDQTEQIEYNHRCPRCDEHNIREADLCTKCGYMFSDELRPKQQDEGNKLEKIEQQMLELQAKLGMFKKLQGHTEKEMVAKMRVAIGK